MSSEAKQNPVALGLTVVATLLLVVPLVRAVTGYYTSDAVWMLPMLLGAGVLYFVANRVKGE
jgi:hypothetical protein